MKKVIVAGHICLDVTPKFSEDRKSSLEDIMVPGKLIQVKDADIHPGGSVSNTGLAMKVLSDQYQVSMMGKIGTDSFGEILSSWLTRCGVEDGMIRSDRESTSYSVVLAVPGYDRIFLHNSGANDSFLAAEVPQEALQQAALLHFGYPPLMKSMYQEEGKELVELMKRAKEAGVTTSLDMAAVDPDAPVGAVNWDQILQKVLPYVDIFVPSIEELCYMLDKERLKRWQKEAKGMDVTVWLSEHALIEEVMPLAEKCMAYGTKILLIKCGAPGLYYQTASKDVLKEIGSDLGLDAKTWADRKGFEYSYEADRVRSATGAGDTCIAGFLSAVLNGEAPEMALHLAAAAGASCVTEYDAISGIRPLSQLKDRIEKGWKKIC